MSKPAVRPKRYIVATRVCPICLGTFIPNSTQQKYCDSCRKNREWEIKQYRNSLTNPKPKANAAIHAKNAEIEAYNRKHGTNYTYGKYIQAKNAGWLEE